MAAAACLIASQILDEEQTPDELWIGMRCASVACLGIAGLLHLVEIDQTRFGAARAARREAHLKSLAGDTLSSSRQQAGSGTGRRESNVAGHGQGRSAGRRTELGSRPLDVPSVPSSLVVRSELTTPSRAVYRLNPGTPTPPAYRAGGGRSWQGRVGDVLDVGLRRAARHGGGTASNSVHSVRRESSRTRGKHAIVASLDDHLPVHNHPVARKGAQVRVVAR
jgi:hypothetical protein